MREIITNRRPKISLNKKPPHKRIKNAFSDLVKENRTSDNPIEKLNAAITNPMIIERKRICDIDLVSNKIVMIRRANAETIIPERSNRFSLFIIDFQNSFYESIHSG